MNRRNFIGSFACFGLMPLSLFKNNEKHIIQIIIGSEENIASDDEIKKATDIIRRLKDKDSDEVLNKLKFEINTHLVEKKDIFYNDHQKLKVIVGNEYRPAGYEDIRDASACIESLEEGFNDPQKHGSSYMITHHGFDIEVINSSKHKIISYDQRGWL